MTRNYLIQLDNIIRQLVNTSRGFRDLKFKVTTTCADMRIKSPNTKLIRIRCFRILSDKELEKLFKHANFLISLKELREWRSMSITKLLANQHILDS